MKSEKGIEKGKFKKMQISVIKHNEKIIQENVFYGLKNGYSEEEISEYEEEAYRELEKLKKFLKSGGTPIFDIYTEMYVMP